MKEGEQVLVFPASRLEPYMAHFRNAIVTDPAVIEDVLDEVLSPPTAFFMDRAAAEKDPAFKQIIPYCVIWERNSPSSRSYVFAYQRTKKGGEDRLHDKWSIGVGGHINPCDAFPGQAGVYGSCFPPLYDAALRRELREEVGMELGPDLGMAAPAAALIYDPSDEVGKVHFGVVHLVKATGEINSSDPALAGGTWTGGMTRRGLMGEKKFENWSQLVQANVKLPE